MGIGGGVDAFFVDHFVVGKAGDTLVVEIVGDGLFELAETGEELVAGDAGVAGAGGEVVGEALVGDLDALVVV